MKIKLQNVRLAFAQGLFNPKVIGDDPTAKPKFSCTLLLDPADPQCRTITEAVTAVAKEKFGAKADQHLKVWRATDSAILRNGDLKSYDGFAGMLYVNANNTMRPTVVNADKTPLVEADGKPYGGCYVHAVVDIWAATHQKQGPYVSATIMGVQFFRDGDSFQANRVASDDDFDVIEGAMADDLT